MSNRVYFAFDYQRDLHRVGEVCDLPGVLSRSAAGFETPKVWQQAKQAGDAAVRALIDDALLRTTATVVCVGMRTATGEFLEYEIERSLAQNNGLVAVTINRIPDRDGSIDASARVSPVIEESGFNVYPYTSQKNLLAHIEEALELAKLGKVQRLARSRQVIEAELEVERRKQVREKAIDGTVRFDDDVYPVGNWSYRGFQATSYSGDRKKSDKVDIEFSVQLDDRRLEFSCQATVLWVLEERRKLAGIFGEMDSESRRTIDRHFGAN